ncbi:MAG: Rpn family recombination-promoting nuclease/putative transposase [Treponema sp.]|jgi:hypothetical protein|nr:Rpn family recombination-promoting nuclease/putative transposase [Treponema sp.]
MDANREYKDSVFSWLFGEPDALRELYGALVGVALGPDIPITINTLEGVLFKGRVNDISFEIGDMLVVLIEHQSTINENMPLRLLMYVARIYERIAGGRDMYRERRIPLPLPEFVVLYNGTAPYPDEAVLKLSDSFADPSGLGLGKGGSPPLDLAVRVYNINQGHNAPIMSHSKTLEGYSVFIAKVREYERKLKSRDEAMRAAVAECIKEGILKDFLETHAAEVINMLLTEWNWDDAFAVQREEGREEGREKGREEGLEEGRNMVLELVRRGYSAEQIEAELAAGKTERTETAGK